jgi:hypothetical protein
MSENLASEPSSSAAAVIALLVVACLCRNIVNDAKAANLPEATNFNLITDQANVRVIFWI